MTQNENYLGIIQVTGPNDVGKTTFALESGAGPERILFIDDDVKAAVTVRQLGATGAKFGKYIDFAAATKGLTMFDTFVYGRELLEVVKPDQYDAIIVDTWSRFGQSIKAYVTARPKEFRAPNEWAPLGAMKGAQQWSEAQRFEAALLAELSSKAKQVFLITHLKDDYASNVKTGKQVPASSRTLARVCSMRLWLFHNPSGSPVPCALVLKRPSIKKMKKGIGLRTVNLLPRKLTPARDDESLWDTLDGYAHFPHENRVPEEHERPTELELSILDGTLTKEQQATLRLSLQAMTQQENAYAEAYEKSDIAAAVRAEFAAGVKPKAIAKEHGLTVREVRTLVKENADD